MIFSSSSSWFIHWLWEWMCDFRHPYIATHFQSPFLSDHVFPASHVVHCMWTILLRDIPRSNQLRFESNNLQSIRKTHTTETRFQVGRHCTHEYCVRWETTMTSDSMISTKIYKVSKWDRWMEDSFCQGLDLLPSDGKADICLIIHIRSTGT